MPAQNVSANGPASVSLHVDYQNTVHPPLEEKRLSDSSADALSSATGPTLPPTAVLTGLDICQVCTDGERSICHTKTYNIYDHVQHDTKKTNAKLAVWLCAATTRILELFHQLFYTTWTLAIPGCCRAGTLIGLIGIISQV